jgi:hypothetical protein
LLQNSPRIPKSTHRDVADARDGPGSPTVALYVGFGCARRREKSKIPIPGSDDGIQNPKSKFCNFSKSKILIFEKSNFENQSFAIFQNPTFEFLEVQILKF